MLIVAHFEDVHCVNSVDLGRRSSATEQGTCKAGSLVGLAGTRRWQRVVGPWRTASHYIRSGSAPLIGARLGISSVVPSSLETFFWATDLKSAMPHAVPRRRVLGPGWAAGAFPNEPLQGARALIH